ncbi:unnamed protein product [Miscanthus lutarioriparius]|uniref:Uncharacterized protein n=1 Tax=Miscanthus lutarioriparius TaxID=422564 RepID=A0A811MPB5_9POAL|nr:unnamed protein product [Miscanthus lutarioriparius]
MEETHAQSAVADSRIIHEGGHQAKCKGPISPVRAVRATAAAAERHADTQASSTTNTMSTTNTVSANGIDILPALPVPDPGSAARSFTWPGRQPIAGNTCR